MALATNRHFGTEFQRTIVTFDGPSNLKELSPQMLESAGGEEREIASEKLKIRFAQSSEAMESATMLVQKRYRWRGFPGATLHKHPNRITILTYLRKQIVATVTVGYDSDQGLLADEIYKDTVDALRAQGRRVGELSKLAIDQDMGSKRVLGALIHIAYLYGILNRCTDAVIEILPRHKVFYERMLGFRQVGEQRLNHRVKCDVVLMHLSLDVMGERIAEMGGRASSSTDRSLYPYFFSKHDQEGIMGRLLKGE
jgi:hypothetical protein